MNFVKSLPSRLTALILSAGAVVACSDDTAVAGSAEVDAGRNDIHERIRSSFDVAPESESDPDTSDTEKDAAPDAKQIEPVVCGDTIRKKIEASAAAPEKCSGKLSLEMNEEPCAIEAMQLQKALTDHAAKIMEEVDCVLSKGNFFTVKAMIDFGQTVYAKSKDGNDNWEILFSELLAGEGWMQKTLKVSNAFTMNKFSVYSQFELAFLKNMQTGEIKSVRVSTEDLSGQCMTYAVHEMRIGKTKETQPTTVPEIAWQSKDVGEEGKGYIEERITRATTKDEQQLNFACKTIGANYKSCSTEDKKSATVCGESAFPVAQPKFTKEKRATLAPDKVKKDIEALSDAMDAMRKKNKVMYPFESK